jgi:hypothetical protein
MDAARNAESRLAMNAPQTMGIMHQFAVRAPALAMLKESTTRMPFVKRQVLIIRLDHQPVLRAGQSWDHFAE